MTACAEPSVRLIQQDPSDFLPPPPSAYLMVMRLLTRREAGDMTPRTIAEEEAVGEMQARLNWLTPEQRGRTELSRYMEALMRMEK